MDWIDLPEWTSKGDGSRYTATWTGGISLDVEVTRERCWPGLGIMGGMVHRELYEHALTLLPRRWFCLLDAPCGAGYGSILLAQAGRGKVVGMDNDETAIRFASQCKPHRARFNEHETLQCSFVGGYLDRDLYEEPLVDDGTGPGRFLLPVTNITDGRFQAITCIEGIEHTSKPERTLRYFREALTPPSAEYPDAGVLYLTTPERDDARGMGGGGYHVTEYTEAQMREMLGAAGFVDVQRHRVHAFLESLVMTARVPS